MGKCKYHDTDLNACARFSTFGGAYQHLVPCHKCELFEPITNYDRIKGMSKEQLAEVLSRFCSISENCDECPIENCPCCESKDAWLAWLNSEENDGTENNK